MSTGWISLILKPHWISNSISLTIVTGLQEIYNNLKSDSFFRSQIIWTTFLCNPSLGGSMMTSPRLFSLFFISGFWVNAFSAGLAKKTTSSSIPLIFALYHASVIASSTISIQTSLLPLPDFKKLIPIVPVPQYKSNIVHSICPTIRIAWPKSCCAQRVFV